MSRVMELCACLCCGLVGGGVLPGLMGAQNPLSPMAVFEWYTSQVGVKRATSKRNKA